MAVKKTKRVRSCGCFTRVNKLLEKQGATLQWVWSFREGYMRTAIVTERLRPRVKLRTLVASFCPFCGKKYPETPEDRKHAAAAKKVKAH